MPATGSFKTPPCVLRNNANEAEKKLEDIEKFTQREKWYTPDVAKLVYIEEHTKAISHLKQEINTLTEKGKEKESQLTELSNKLSKTEDELQALSTIKSDLEKQCNDYKTKITDWKVNYETLKNKFKNREQELLSLLEDRAQRKPDLTLGLQNLYEYPLGRRYALDNLEYLLKTEKKTEPPRIRNASRACVINWIVKVHISSGNPAVVQQTCCYLDKYLSSSLVTASRMQLITAGCFWIATKLDDSFVSGQRMVEYSGNAFNRNELVAAERNILRKFNFEVQAVVPQDFIPYFSWWCGQAQCADVEAAATFICLCGLIVDETLNGEYPSVIAAAAVKVSLALLFKSIRVAQLHTCPIYKAAEKKSRNISTTCDQLYSALRVIRSSKSEYETLLDKYAGNYIVSKIFEHL